MTDKEYSELPAGPLSGEPVLCLDIDGVSSPLGQDNRYDLHAPTPGFVHLPVSDDAEKGVLGVGCTMQAHPSLPTWIGELEQAFAHCVWVSSWRDRSFWFASGAGLGGALDWPYLMPADDPPVPGDTLTAYKLEAVRAWVTPETPVAIVDDHLVDQDRSAYEQWIEMQDSTALFVQRPGPVLLIGPDQHIGLTRPIVDMLCRFARDPHDPAFGLRCTLQPDKYQWVQWPWPLPPGQECPVLVRPGDEDAWNKKREALREEVVEQQREQFRRQVAERAGDP